MFNGKNETEALQISLALEFLQAFALIHDDIMDRADTRRGIPTVHKAIEKTVASVETHCNASLHATHYGLSQAILLGDLAFAYCHEIIGTALNENYSGDALQYISTEFQQTFATMTEEVIWGQQLDLQMSVFPSFDREKVSKIMTYKTGLYTIARPLQLGAILAGAKQEELNLLKEIGINLGIAFQIQDDLLGLTGDETIIGKSILSDLLERKITLPIIETYNSSPTNKKLIEEFFALESVTQKSAEDIKTIILQPEILERIKLSITNILKQAIDKVPNLSISDCDKQWIAGFGDYLVTRIH